MTTSYEISVHVKILHCPLLLYSKYKNIVIQWRPWPLPRYFTSIKLWLSNSKITAKGQLVFVRSSWQLFFTWLFFFFYFLFSAQSFALAQPCFPTHLLLTSGCLLSRLTQCFFVNYYTFTPHFLRCTYQSFFLLDRRLLNCKISLSLHVCIKARWKHGLLPLRPTFQKSTNCYCEITFVWSSCLFTSLKTELEAKLPYHPANWRSFITDKLFCFCRHSVNSLSSAHEKEPDWTGFTSLKRTNDSWQKDSIQFWQEGAGRRQRHKNCWSSSVLYHQLSMKFSFTGTIEPWLSRTKQWLTTTSPPSHQPNKLLRQLGGASWAQLSDLLLQVLDIVLWGNCFQRQISKLVGKW